MATVTMKDGTSIYYKDWGTGQPIVFSHGWPLTADAWDDQMVFLADRGYRCIARFKDLTLPFYGFNREGAKVSEGVRDSFWLQCMMAGHKNALDCIKAFSETDFTKDLERIDVPTLIMHGDDDQIVPIGASAIRSAASCAGRPSRSTPGCRHGMCTINKEQINADLLAFINA